LWACGRIGPEANADCRHGELEILPREAILIGLRRGNAGPPFFKFADVMGARDAVTRRCQAKTRSKATLL
jgi:hypothetical protein